MLKLTGKEEFTFQNNNTGFNIQEYWKWFYSDIYSMHANLAEFIVAKALGNENPYNSGSWTLYRRKMNQNRNKEHLGLQKHIANIRIATAN